MDSRWARGDFRHHRPGLHGCGLLDEWHAQRLPAGRFCYQPVPCTPAEATPLPCLRNGFVTFGCFNNTAKFNDGVFDVWARVLAALPNSRLVLKWRTFNDDGLRRARRGIRCWRSWRNAANG